MSWQKRRFMPVLRSSRLSWRGNDQKWNNTCYAELIPVLKKHDRAEQRKQPKACFQGHAAERLHTGRFFKWDKPSGCGFCSNEFSFMFIMQLLHMTSTNCSSYNLSYSKCIY